MFQGEVVQVLLEQTSRLLDLTLILCTSVITNCLLTVVFFNGQFLVTLVGGLRLTVLTTLGNQKPPTPAFHRSGILSPLSSLLCHLSSVLRALMLEKKDPERWSMIWSLMSHNEARQKEKYWTEKHRPIIKLIR